MSNGNWKMQNGAGQGTWFLSGYDGFDLAMILQSGSHELPGNVSSKPSAWQCIDCLSNANRKLQQPLLDIRAVPPFFPPVILHFSFSNNHYSFGCNSQQVITYQYASTRDLRVAPKSNPNVMGDLNFSNSNSLRQKFHPEAGRR
jgi:hypothetical protein